MTIKEFNIKTAKTELANRNREGVLEHNMSDIYTSLIHATGRYCDHWASDLLYNIQEIDEAMTAFDGTPTTHVVAIRQCGVDGNTYFAAKDKRDYPKEYRALFTVTIQPATREGWDAEIVFTEYNV